MLHYFKMLLQLLMAPSNGWIAVAHDTMDYRTLVRRGYLPMILICGLSGFMQMLYPNDMTWLAAIQKAIVEMVAFVITGYFAEFMFSLLLLKDISTSLNMHVIRLYITYTLSILAMMVTLMNLVPFSPVLILLPLYTIVVMRTGTKFVGVLHHRIGHFMFLSIGSIFVPVFTIILLFGLLIR